MKKDKFILLALLIFSLTLFLTGCSTNSTNPIGNSSPTARFVATPREGKAPLDVSFDASTSNDSDGYVTAYQWNFGDGDTEDWSSPSHTFESPGEYTVSLTVYDDEGASDSISKKISISGYKIEILDWSLEEDWLSAWVEGRAKNISGKTLDYAQIKAKFYDSSDALLSSHITSISDFEAGEVWSFEIGSYENPDDVDHAVVKLGDINVY